jgi:hypothetical protein
MVDLRLRGARVLSLGLLASVWLGVNGCGPKEEQKRSPAGPVAYDDFAGQFGQTYCESIADCCRTAGYSTATCQSSIVAAVNASFARYANDPNVVFDETAAGHCLDAYAAYLEACTNPALEDGIRTACRGLFKGTVPLGGSCKEDVDCIPQGEQVMECNTGVCTVSEFQGQPEVDAALGEPCGGTGYPDGGGYFVGSDPGVCQLDQGLYCTSAEVCAVVPKLGQACQMFAGCELDSTCTGGICTAIAPGSTCGGGEECLRTEYCDYDQSLCVTIKPNGQPCNQGNQCTSGQCVEDKCRAFSVATPQVCAGAVND